MKLGVYIAEVEHEDGVSRVTVLAKTDEEATELAKLALGKKEFGTIRTKFSTVADHPKVVSIDDWVPHNVKEFLGWINVLRGSCEDEDRRHDGADIIEVLDKIEIAIMGEVLDVAPA